MATGTTVVHVTHEAVGKIGGIGEVLQGFFTCPSYLKAVERSILVGPLFSTEGSVKDRLGRDGEVLYSSVDGFLNPSYRGAFEKIEACYGVGIVYGRRTFTDSETGVTSSPEVLLIDVRHSNPSPINEFKRRMYENFGIESHRHEHIWEYEQYVRLGPPAIAALKALGTPSGSTTVVSHEFMGMPTALEAILDRCCLFRTVFYAHEVAPIRRLVEENPGHDTLFYNVMRQAHARRLYVKDVFGDQSTYFKNALVEASKHCDKIFAVGDYVVDELRFLAPEFANASIDVVYNGIPAYEISLSEKLESRARLQTYVERLLGWCPDYLFTHVTRLVRSKGLWRDLRVLEALDSELRVRNKTAVLLVLSTEAGQRHPSDIHAMESAYNWPVTHREGWPDLSGGEAAFYAAVQAFNARSQTIQVVFINQFGFETRLCGQRMPQEMEFMDIRKGSDVEFGQSIYEPFGIAQLEPLTFGAICVVSRVCGCSGFFRDVSQGQPDVKNVLIADYTLIENGRTTEIKDLTRIDQAARERTEEREARTVAAEILRRLPQNEADMEHLLRTGHALARHMSWTTVVDRYLLGHLQDMDRRAAEQSVAC